MRALAHRLRHAARPLLLLTVGAGLLGTGVMATPVQPTASAESEQHRSIMPTSQPAKRPQTPPKRAARRVRAAPTRSSHQPSAPASPAPGGRRVKRPIHRPPPTRSTAPAPPFQPSAPGDRVAR